MIERSLFTAMNVTRLPGALRADAGLWRVRHFTPNWFAVTMGTGGLALALNQFPLDMPGLAEIGRALWLANIALFVLFSGMYAARWLLYFDEAKRIFRHPVMSMFLGAIPMGLATIINGFLAFGIPLWGQAAIDIAAALWWIDIALALACGTVIPFLMFTRQQHSLERMTAVWLLPIVAAEVAAASGGLLVPHLAPADGFTVEIISYALWAYSVLPALGILVLLLLRLVLHRLPPSDMAASCWLALGPLGTGALALVLLGNNAPALFAARGLASVGDVAFGAGILGAVVLWGYGAWWLVLAILKTVQYVREGFPFNLGWWALTFPVAVYALATLALARATGFGLFAVVGGVLVVALAILWSIVAIRTARGAWEGRLFVSPCLDPAYDSKPALLAA
ncbi:MAG TPA: TDT family transporter [Kaistia sp.]|nr:TDT family transporter [Kaistia sp.]